MLNVAIDIEGVVREVLRRLRATDDSPANSVVAAIAASSESTPERNQLVLVDPLVTNETLRGRLRGIERVLVPAKAVVTPAVRDRLREMKVTLEFAQAAGAETTERSAAGGTASVPGAMTKLYIHQSGARFDAANLVRRIADMAIGETLVGCPLGQAVTELAAVLISAGTLGLLVTPQWAQAQGLANRAAGVRAFVAVDVRMVREANRDWPANLLVVDPSRSSPRDITNMASEFVRCVSAK